MGKQNKKQEVTNRKLDLSNVKKAGKVKDEKKEAPDRKETLVAVKFKVHKDLIKRFQNLRIDYSKQHERFDVSNNLMFKIMVLFMEKMYEDDNVMQRSPDDFRKYITRPGKRKATDRTYTQELNDEIVFTIPEYVSDTYMDVMFSYIRKDKSASVFDDHYSRPYFFYDFMDYMDANKKELMKFKEPKS